MTVEEGAAGEAIAGERETGAAMTAGSGPSEGEPAESEAGGRPSRAALVWATLGAVALASWFFFAWLVLGRMMLDAASEAIGSGLLLLLLISIIGALARGRGTD